VAVGESAQIVDHRGRATLRGVSRLIKVASTGISDPATAETVPGRGRIPQSSAGQYRQRLSVNLLNYFIKNVDYFSVRLAQLDELPLRIRQVE
jgi:hypothetical protein